MTDYQIKLAAALPKGDVNGLDDFDLITTLHQQQTEGRTVQPRVALLVYDVADAGVNAEGVHWVKLRIRQVEPVATQAGRKAAKQMLADEFSARTGQALPPYEVTALAKSAFRDLPRSIEEIDADEEREREAMSPADELRRHLEVVHGATKLGKLTDSETEAFHEAQHRTAMFTAGPLAHELSWSGWSRGDLELSEIDADDLPGWTDDNRAGDDPEILAGDMPVLERVRLEHAREDAEAEGTLFDPAVMVTQDELAAERSDLGPMFDSGDDEDGESEAIFLPLPPERLDDEAAGGSTLNREEQD